nr:hypothetical protein [uncultured Undibacterium sp.]
MRMKKNGVLFLIAASVLTTSFMPLAVAQDSNKVAAKLTAKLSMEQIMANTDWMGIAPERPYFSQDGKNIYFSRKAIGSELRDLYRVSANGGTAQKLSAAEVVVAESEQKFTSPDRTHTVWLRNGNLFLLKDGKRQQLTRTGEMNGLLGFVGNDQISMRNDGKVILFNLRNGEQSMLLNIKNDDDPIAKK